MQADSKSLANQRSQKSKFEVEPVYIMRNEKDLFESLVSIIRQLQGPDGCPWDKEQTLVSMRSSLIEESYEVIEAIDLNSDSLLEEELGDLFCQAIFLSLLGEKEKKCTLKAILGHITEKLIRRHPHVFGQEVILEDAEAVVHNWEKIKAKEHKHTRKSALDGIPKDLPSLARAQKMIKKMKGSLFKKPQSHDISIEEKMGEELFSVVQKCHKMGIQADQALRKYLMELEMAFRNEEVISEKGG